MFTAHNAFIDHSFKANAMISEEYERQRILEQLVARDLLSINVEIELLNPESTFQTASGVEAQIHHLSEQSIVQSYSAFFFKQISQYLDNYEYICAAGKDLPFDLINRELQKKNYLIKDIIL